MYWTLLKKPSIKSHVVNRLIDESDRETPYTAQVSDNTQECIGTVLCAAHDDVVNILRYMEDTLTCFNVTNGTSPQQEGLDQFQGQITGLRYLRTDETDDGEYLINPGI